MRGSSVPTLAIALLGTVSSLVWSGCGAREPARPAARAGALNASPSLNDFVVAAANSVRLQTGAAVAGGDVGARGTGAGPFLSAGFAIDIGGAAGVTAADNVIADSVRLGAGAHVGDVQTNHFTDGLAATHGTVTALVALPALPETAPVTPGATNLTVAAGATTVAAPGRFAAVSVGAAGRLRLPAGTYEMASLTVGAGARVEALGPVELRVANRFSSSSLGFLGPAPGVTLGARSIRLEISGQNGATGALSATPKAASFGTSFQITGLVLVPNGTLVLGAASSGRGAFLARDVDLQTGASLTFEEGFPGCTATSCDDGNACNGLETCGPTGSCLPGAPVVCLPLDQCHQAGVCDPGSGVCSNPAKADGTGCSDGNACTQTDSCQAGSCLGGDAVVCSAPGCTNPGTCDPATGMCSAPTGCGVGCGNGVVEGDPPSSLELSWLATSCLEDGQANIRFRINGQLAWSERVSNACSCEPGIRTRLITDPAILALIRGGQNVFSVQFPELLAWAVVRVTGQQTQEVVLIDSGGGGDAEARNPDLCAAGAELDGGGTGDVNAGEECDDGNTVSGDGCSAACLSEVCGNGRVDAAEQCDDGNLTAGDGCNATCGREFCGDAALTSAPGPTSATFAWAANTCAPTGGVVRFSVNGQQVFSGALASGCSCDMTVQEVTSTDPAVLAAFNNGGSNAVSFEMTGTGEAESLLGWAAIRLSGVTIRDVVVHDSGQGGDAVARRGALCAPGETSYELGDITRSVFLQPWGGEECDDGNGTFGDGCSDTCKLEGCGDGRRTTGEECDDGNRDGGDGCSASCVIEGCSFCDPRTGECLSRQDGLSCDDGNGCTPEDTCSAGSCLGQGTLACNTPTACQEPGFCDPSSGGCFYPPRSDGAICDDGSACTKGDSCRAGACGGTPLVCRGAGPCRGPGVCQPQTGECTYSAVADGTSCDDVNVCTRGDRCMAGACVGQLATCPDPTVSTDLGSALSPLYLAANPVQTGVEPGTIEPARAAGVAGRVLQRGGQPLAGVTVRVHGHPELGQTLSQADGTFRLAANGGETLVLAFTKAGHLPANRHVPTTWQRSSQADDVVLIPLDPQATAVDLSGGGGLQVVSASAVSDGDGTRQARLLVPAGTTAELENADGSRTAAATLTIRGTEYTVGEDGPAAMPAPLPPGTGYTYAIEYSADEALASGARAVRFSNPVIHYNENFLGFRVGTVVPTGYYDRDRTQWIPSENGRVVKILGVTGGLADLDVDGSGQAASPAQLAAMGVTAAERERLAQLYAPATVLWRVPMDHFTPWDCNWPYGPPAGARSPNVADTSTDDTTPEADDGEDEDPDCRSGNSLVECANRVLRESVPVAGTSMSLTYSSRRVEGSDGPYTLTIPLTGDQLPPGIASVVLKVAVGGKFFNFRFSPLTGLEHQFIWDGKDTDGSALQGKQAATIEIGYAYPAVYLEPGAFPRAFGQYAGQTLSPDRARQEVVLWQRFDTTMSRVPPLGTWLASAQRMGSWSLSAHHAYDANGRTLYLGNGDQRSAASASHVITTLPNTGVPECLGLFDRFPDVQAPGLDHSCTVGGVTVAPDGSLYLAETNVHRITRLHPDGRSELVAGKGNAGFAGDGGPATEATLHTPLMLAFGPDGSLFFVDSQLSRVRRISPDGVIQTVAGTGGFSNDPGEGDGGPAVLAPVSLMGLAVASDGSLMLSGFHSVRRVGPDGIINTAIGGGNSTPGAMPIPVREAAIAPRALVYGPDGDLYLETLSGMMSAGSDGMLRRLSDLQAPVQQNGDGLPLARVQIPSGNSLLSARDGSLLLDDFRTLFSNQGDSLSSRIRVIDPRRIINTFAGTVHGNTGSPYLEDDYLVRGLFPGEKGPATAVPLRGAPIALAPDGTVYSASRVPGIRRISRGLPAFDGAPILIASPDGAELYSFSAQGRHLATRHALTGGLIRRFEYDDDGLLRAIVDGDGLTTVVQRDGAGVATGIVAPNGQRTALTVVDGNLESLTTPGNELHDFGYQTGHLLASYRRPHGLEYTYQYDQAGHLLATSDPAGGSLTLASMSDPPLRESTATTALGRVTSQRLEDLPDGSRRTTVVSPGGVSSIRETRSDGTALVTAPDGMVSVGRVGPDPRFGLDAPLVSSLTVRTPAGLTKSVSEKRTVEMSATDATQLVSASHERTVNGRKAVTTFDAGTRTFTSISPAGRQRTYVVDQRGRVVRSQYGNYEPVAYGYDARGRLHTVVSGVGGSAPRTTTLGYDPLDRVSTIEDPVNRTTGFFYDASNRLIRHRRPNGTEIAFGYDANGNLTSVTPAGRPAHVFGYSPVDLQSRYEPPAVGPASITTMLANVDRQHTKVVRADGSEIAIGYDATSGRRASHTFPDLPAGPAKTLTYAYVPATGALQSITTSQGDGIAVTFDGSLITSSTATGVAPGTVSMTYNTDFQLASETVAGDAVTLDHDDDGLVTRVGDLTFARDPASGDLDGSTLGSVTEARARTSFGELQGLSVQAAGSNVLSQTLVRDAAGRVSQNTEVIGGVTTVHQYGYDDVGQLEEVKRNGVVTASYGYDDNGNRLSRTAGATTETGSYDDQDRVTSYGNVTYAYGATGEVRTTTDVATAAVTTYDYDGLGALRRVALPDGRTIEYVSDGLGRRIAKKVNGAVVRRWLYRNALVPVAEVDASGALVARFVAGAYMVKDGRSYRLVKDHLGSLRAVVDAQSGAVVQRMEFDEFGRVASDTQPGFQPFGFGGGLHDPDTGLVQFGARDYDPRAGRWLQRDPLLFRGAQFNLYAYVGNDPINNVDPTGLTFTPGDSESIAALARLAANPTIGPLIDRLENNPNIDIGINASPPTSDIRESGGGRTSTTREDPGAIDIVWNMDVAREMTGGKCGQPQVQTIEQLIAHEIGHAYAHVYRQELTQLADLTGGQQAASDAMAVSFENALRGSGPYRMSH